MKTSKEWLEEVKTMTKSEINPNNNLIQTPWQNITAETAVMRAMDNLISTYGEDFVLDLIGSAYVAPGYES